MNKNYAKFYKNYAKFYKNYAKIYKNYANVKKPALVKQRFVDPVHLTRSFLFEIFVFLLEFFERPDDVRRSTLFC